MLATPIGICFLENGHLRELGLRAATPLVFHGFLRAVPPSLTDVKTLLTQHCSSAVSWTSCPGTGQDFVNQSLESYIKGVKCTHGVVVTLARFTVTFKAAVLKLTWIVSDKSSRQGLGTPCRSMGQKV